MSEKQKIFSTVSQTLANKLFTEHAVYSMCEDHE